MRIPSRPVALLTALAVLFTGCASTKSRPRPRGYEKMPYAIELTCEEAALEVGRPVRIGTTDGRTMIGHLTAVNCEATGVLVMDVSQRGGRYSTEILMLDTVASIEVLEDDSEKMGAVGVVMAAGCVSVLVVVALLGNLQAGFE